MTLRVILWRVVPWTVTIGMAAACFALAYAWQGPHSNDPSTPSVVVSWAGVAFCLVLVCGAIAAIFGAWDPLIEDRARYFGRLAAWLTGGSLIVTTVGGFALFATEIGAWSLVAVLAALLSSVILATTAACTALYVGTSDKRKALKQKERKRDMREVLG